MKDSRELLQIEPSRRIRALLRRREAPHLFSHWRSVSRRLKRAPHIALFLDFDGTLTPLRRRPEKVWLEEPTRAALKDLSRLSRLDIWIISGRRRSDVRARVRVPGIAYLGLHGWERQPDRTIAPTTLAALKKAKESFRKSLRSLERIRVEDKKFSFAIHYRDASPSTVRRARELLDRVLKKYKSQLQVLKGKKVWEVLPKCIPGKGSAAARVVSRCRTPVLPIYLGDDKTDESAFASLAAGLTVRVGTTRHTRAQYRLDQPEEVREFLRRLKGIIS